MRRPATLLVALLVPLLALSPAVPSAAEPAAPPPSEPTAAVVDESPLAVAQDALAGGSDTEVTLALRDLWLARPTMTPRDRRAARRLLARPDSPAAHPRWRYPETVATEQECGPRVCVTHVASTRHAATEAWAASTLELVETAWTRIVDQMGYRAPPPDAGAGGDDRFDVYLADLGHLTYGWCAPSQSVPGQEARSSSYCVLDNDMAGLTAHPLEALAATAAHEFFHAVQFNYDVAEDAWFMEATATWVESQVFPHVHDNTQFLAKGQLGAPTTPLDAQSGQYGNWIFAEFLARRWGRDTVRHVWERLDASTGARDEWSLQGVRRHLASRGDAWGEAYADFVRANFRPARHYAPSLRHRRAPVGARMRVHPRAPERTRTTRLAHLSSTSLKVTVGGRKPRGRALRLRFDVTRRAHARVQVLVHRRNGTVLLRKVRLGRQGRGALRVAAGRKLRHVVVLGSHSGAEHRNCGRASGWACGGDPVGLMRLTVTATLR